MAVNDVRGIDDMTLDVGRELDDGGIGDERDID